jgi:hypothetical protein
MLQLPRTIDLSIEEDARLLRGGSSEIPALAELIQNELLDYLRLFPEEHWRKIYPNGWLDVKAKNRAHTVMDIEWMLRITRSLKKLSGYKGFEKLLAGFRNPAQVLATVFELEVAEWCAGRAVTLSLEFGPEVLVKGRRKYPEFLWKTSLGDLYVECKRGEEIDNDFARRLENYREFVEKEHKRHAPWHESFRLDIVIAGARLNGTQWRLRDVISRASIQQSGDAGTQIQVGEICATFRSRVEAPPMLPGMASAGCIVVGTQPTKLDFENAMFTISMSIEAHRARAAGQLLREARTQLPTDHLSAVFIQIGSIEVCQKKVAALLQQRAYANTPWVAIWGSGGMRAVWHMNQPFDNRLLMARQ